MIELLLTLLFIAGVVLKVLHVPYHSVVMAAGLLGMMIYYVWTLSSRNPSVRKMNGWLGLATVSWLIFFFSEAKFMGGTLVIMGLSLFVSILSLLMTLREKGALAPGRIFILLTALFLGATTSWMEVSTRYYVFNMHFSPKAWTDYLTLDKYSWFLYTDRKFEEALVINGKAYDAAKAVGAEYYLPRVEEHQEAIRKRSWGAYE